MIGEGAVKNEARTGLGHRPTQRTRGGDSPEYAVRNAADTKARAPNHHHPLGRPWPSFASLVCAQALKRATIGGLHGELEDTDAFVDRMVDCKTSSPSSARMDNGMMRPPPARQHVCSRQRCRASAAQIRCTRTVPPDPTRRKSRHAPPPRLHTRARLIRAARHARHCPRPPPRLLPCPSGLSLGPSSHLIQAVLIPDGRRRRVEPSTTAPSAPPLSVPHCMELVLVPDTADGE
jgi:hypothetical protein